MPGLGTEAPKVARAWLAANMPEAVVTKELVTEVVKTLSEELSGEELSGVAPTQQSQLRDATLRALAAEFQAKQKAKARLGWQVARRRLEDVTACATWLRTANPTAATGASHGMAHAAAWAAPPWEVPPASSATAAGLEPSLAAAAAVSAQLAEVRVAAQQAEAREAAAEEARARDEAAERARLATAQEQAAAEKRRAAQEEEARAATARDASEAAEREAQAAARAAALAAERAAAEERVRSHKLKAQAQARARAREQRAEAASARIERALRQEGRHAVRETSSLRGGIWVAGPLSASWPAVAPAAPAASAAPTSPFALERRSAAKLAARDTARSGEPRQPPPRRPASVASLRGSSSVARCTCASSADAAPLVTASRQLRTSSSLRDLRPELSSWLREPRWHRIPSRPSRPSSAAAAARDALREAREPGRDARELDVARDATRRLACARVRRGISPRAVLVGGARAASTGRIVAAAAMVPPSEWRRGASALHTTTTNNTTTNSPRIHSCSGYVRRRADMDTRLAP